MFRNRQSSSYCFSPSSTAPAWISSRNSWLCRRWVSRGEGQHWGPKADAFLVPSQAGRLSTTGGVNRFSLIGAWAYGIPRYATTRWVLNIFMNVPMTMPWPGISTVGGSRAQVDRWTRSTTARSRTSRFGVIVRRCASGSGVLKHFTPHAEQIPKIAFVWFSGHKQPG